MNTLVVYDSKFGNTEQIARAIAGAFEGNTSVRVQAVSDVPLTLDGVDLLIMGGPTHAHGLSAPMREFLQVLPEGALKNGRVAAFDTRYRIPQFLSGSAASKIAKALRKKGAQILAPPQSFFVDHTEGPLIEGELERATGWAKELLVAADGQVKEVAVARS